MKKGKKKAKSKREDERVIAIHCGVVGNIQAFHVCAPGSIPGDGTFFRRKERIRGEDGIDGIR